MEIKAKNIFYDYETKYTQGMSEYVLANDIPRKTYTKIQDLTMRCHNLLGCKGVTRTDFRLEEGEFLSPYVLELNTNPGLTKTSLIPKLAAFQDISYNNLINIIIEDAIC